jgi:hypothetical protein
MSKNYMQKLYLFNEDSIRSVPYFISGNRREVKRGKGVLRSIKTFLKFLFLRAVKWFRKRIL